MRPDRVAEAFHQMQSGRPRPVGLECAVDVWPRSAEVRDGKKVTVGTAEIDPSAIEAAAALLGAAKSPLMVVGGGAQHASVEATALAEWLQMPVAAGQMGFGVVDSRHPLSIPLPVAHKLWSQVDVVLAVGTRLHLQQMAWGLDADLKIIRIDIDAKRLPDLPRRRLASSESFRRKQTSENGTGAASSKRGSFCTHWAS